jgi:regulator of nucleoside diphosphate kinase
VNRNLDPAREIARLGDREGARSRLREPAIILGDADVARLRAAVEWHLSGRDRESAERLEAELDRAIVVPQREVPPGIVTMGSRVLFEDADTGRTREITLSYPMEADPASGRISILAPVAAALLGLGIGDSIEWPMPDGRQATLRMAAVLYQPEASGVPS